MDTPDKLVCYPANLRSGWAPPTGNAGNLPNHRSRAMNRNRKCRAVSAILAPTLRRMEGGSQTLRRGVDSGVIEETARLDESYTPIPLKHLASCQIEGSR